MKDYKTDRGIACGTFCQSVYQIVQEIPCGKVSTYGDIARLMGQAQASRMVGYALKHIPDSLILPCHRVVNAVGRLVPGWDEQYRLLLEEGVYFKKNGTVDMKISLWKYDEIA